MPQLSPEKAVEMMARTQLLTDPPVEPPEGDEYLLRWAWTLGSDVSWSDLRTWADFMGVKLTEWQAKVLHSLSWKIGAFSRTKELDQPYGRRPELIDEIDRVEANKLKTPQKGMVSLSPDIRRALAEREARFRGS